MILNIKLEPPYAQTCTHKHVYPLHVLPHIHTFKKEDNNDLSYINFQTSKNALAVVCDHCETMSLLELLGSSWNITS